MGFAKEKIEPLYSPEEYLAFERDAQTRYEFLDGYVFAMAGESLSHSRICTNLMGEVRNILKGKPCEPLSPNMKVKTAMGDMFAYPDLTIVCGKPQFHDSKKDVLINPKVIFEVLSPSTERYDRTTKFQRYRLGNETLTDYILVSQDKVFVEHFHKQADGQWLYQSFSELADIVRIKQIECEVAVRETYDRVEFEAEKLPAD